MYLYFRICEKQTTNGFGTRWQNTDKLTIMKKCWLSLQPGLFKEDTVIFINDGCSPTLLDWLESTTSAKTIDSPVPEHEPGPHYSFVHCAKEMNDRIRFTANDIHYICEDDYLHLPQALTWVKNLYQRSGWKGFAVLYDYPDRYTLDRTRLCELMINETNHWRTVPSSTGCVMADGATWQKYMTILQQSARNNSDSFTWHAFSNTPCLAPIPGLATHLTEGCLTPLFPTQQLWDSINEN